MEIQSAFLEKLYLNAKTSLVECLNNKENSFLQTEIEIPLAHIGFKEEHVKFLFPFKSKGSYQVEVKIKLLGKLSVPIGEYLYYEDEFGRHVDDQLLFF